MLAILQVIDILKRELSLHDITTVLDLGCGSFYRKSLDLVDSRDILTTVFNGKNIM